MVLQPPNALSFAAGVSFGVLLGLGLGSSYFSPSPSSSSSSPLRVHGHGHGHGQGHVAYADESFPSDNRACECDCGGPRPTAGATATASERAVSERSWWIDETGLLQMAVSVSNHFDGEAKRLALGPDVSEIWLDIGVNMHKTTPPGKDFKYLSSNPNAYYLAFEPLLAKYAVHIAEGIARTGELFADSGLLQLPHFRRRRQGMMFPMAVSNQSDRQASFHVSRLDGCSSLNEQRPSDELRHGGWRGNLIQKVVTGGCGNDTAQVWRVPTITLDRILRVWLGGREVEFAHIDVQGHEMEVLTSAGSSLKQIKRFLLEVPSPDCVTLTLGAATCNEILKQVSEMGFEPEDAIREDGNTRVGLQRGFGCKDVPWDQWNSKCEFDLLFVRKDL